MATERETTRETTTETETETERPVEMVREDETETAETPNDDKDNAGGEDA